PQAVYARMLMEKPRSIRSIRPTVPEHVEAAVMRALEQLPADRFSSAKEFAEALLGRIDSNRFAPAAARNDAALTWRARLRDPVMIGAAIIAIASLVAAIMR